MPIGRPEEAFRRFLSATGDISEITRSFRLFCDELSMTQDQDGSGENDLLRREHESNDRSGSHPGIKQCEELCGRVNCQESKTLLRCLSDRASHVEYDCGTACRNTKVLVIGAGPCGLRMAIECALLGAASVDVIEMRSYLSRNNGLHLWPFVMDDLRRIGAKVFYPKFGSGSIDHISTKRLQEILLKIALLLGVDVHAPVQFKGIIDPDRETGRGWRASLHGEGVGSGLAEREFDVMIGAAGAKRNVFPGFKRKCFRAKMAIAVTANFVNNFTTEESRVPEISGIAYIYHQDFFKELKHTVGVDLENIVYYKGDTHYFVMTPKKSCLLAKGVLKEDYQDSAALLSSENIDLAALRSFAREAASAATKQQLPAASLKFAKNHLNEDDVAAFDFTALHQAEHSCRVSEKHGHRLLLSIIGDVLLEPFWPIGSGIARGFLGVLDTAWLVRNWSIDDRHPVELIAEREAVFQLLSQTTPDNLKKNMTEYTINPITRYGTRLNMDAIPPEQAQRLYDTDQTTSINSPCTSNRKSTLKRTANETNDREKPNTKVYVDENTLLLWFQNQLTDFADVVQVVDLQDSWRNAMAFCAIVQLYRPDLMNVRNLNANEVEKNARQAFSLIERVFHVVPLLSASDLASGCPIDSLHMITYLFYIYEAVKEKSSPSRSDLPSQYISSKSLEVRQPPVSNASSKQHISVLTVKNNVEGDDHWSRAASLQPPRSNSPTLPSMNVPAGALSNRRSAKRKQRHLLKNSSRSISLTKAHHADVSSQVRRRTARKQISLKRSCSNKNPAVSSCNVNDTNGDPVPLAHRQSEPSQDSELPYALGQTVHASLAFCQGVVTTKKKIFETSGIAEVEEENTAETQQTEKQESPDTISGRVCESAIDHAEPANPSQVTYKVEKRENDLPYTQVQTVHTSLAFCQGVATSKIQNFETAGNDETGDVVTDRTALIRRITVMHNANVTSSSHPGDVSGVAVDATEGTRTESSGRSGRVSKVLSKLEEMAIDDKIQVGVKSMSSRVCYSCSKELYMIDKLTAHGFWFHHACFKCETCNNRLRVGASMIKNEDDGTAKFFCTVHGYRAGIFDVKWQRKDKDGSNLTVNSDAKRYPGMEDNVDYPEIQSNESEATVDSGQVPTLAITDEDDVIADSNSSSIDELSSDENDDDIDGSDDGSGTILETFEEDDDSESDELKNTKISKMILADELHDVRAEEDKIDERARALELTIRLTDSNDLISEWLEMLGVRIVLAKRESQIMLQARLTELKDRQTKLSQQIEQLRMHASYSENSQHVQDKLNELTKHVADLQEFLDLSDYIAE